MSAAQGPGPRILKIEPAEIRPEAVWDAASVLRSGGLVIYPTETFYALGALPVIAEAVNRVFDMKGRDFRKPLPLIASDREAALSAASEWPGPAETLARIFWPGPSEHRRPGGCVFSSRFARGNRQNRHPRFFPSSCITFGPSRGRSYYLNQRKQDRRTSPEQFRRCRKRIAPVG